MGAVQHEQVDPPVQQLAHPLVQVSPDPQRRPGAQPAVVIDTRAWIPDLLEHVLDGDEAAQHPAGIDHRQLFNPVLVEDPLGLLQRGPHRHRDQPILGHHVLDRDAPVGEETEVAIGEDPDQLPLPGDRHAGDVVPLHDLERLAHRQIRGKRHRIGDHAAFRALHLLDLVGLIGDGEILVDDSHPARTRESDGEAGFGHRVHGGRKERDVQAEPRRQLHAEVRVGGQHIRTRRNEQDVVEGQGRAEHTVRHRSSSTAGLSLPAPKRTAGRSRPSRDSVPPPGGRRLSALPAPTRGVSSSLSCPPRGFPRRAKSGR